jgi:hypothetical protein
VSRRILLAAVAVGLLVLPAPAVPAGTVGSMMIPDPAPVSGQFRPFMLDSDHSAFPTVTRLPNGQLRMMWRHGSTHVSNDGQIFTSLGNADGTTWSIPEHVAVDGGGDIRDPHLGPSGLSTINGEVFLTYFVSVNGTPTGARVDRSTDGGATFESSVRIDPNLPYAAISSPVVKIGNRLMTAFYGRKSGESIDTAWAAWSTDNGQTWVSNRIANGISAGRAYQEPWVVANGGTAVFLMRDGSWDAIAMRSTPDGGATWSPLHSRVIPDATGNSASVRASNGRIYTVYRDTRTRAAMLASSGDGGVTFTVERELMFKPAGSLASSVGMTYAHPIELGAGYLFCPVGMERADVASAAGPADSRLYLGYL